MPEQDPSKPLWFKKQLPKLEIQKSPYSIFLATPVHSECSIHYTQALLELQRECHIKRVPIEFQLFKSSLITQGRNLCVSAFMESKMTHLLFVDSDIDFHAQSIFTMLNKNKDVISIPYPLKVIQWEKIFEDVKRGRIKDAKQMALGGNTYPMKLPDEENIKINDGVIEVSHSPTGCLLIKRTVIETMIQKYPHLEIKQDTIINGKPVEKPFLYNFFDTWFDPIKKQYYGEDYAFCKRWGDIGGKCHAYINDLITHVGEHQFCGKFVDELIRTGQNDIK